MTRIALKTALAAIVALGLVGRFAQANELETCDMNPVKQSICVYEAILADIAKTYTMEAGGGITSLRQTMTTQYEATISREEARDVLTYEIAIGPDGAVTIVSRTDSAK